MLSFQSRINPLTFLFTFVTHRILTRTDLVVADNSKTPLAAAAVNPTRTAATETKATPLAVAAVA